MRLVHLSDLHLGYRQYQRQTPAGINQREADVAGAFARAIQKVVELRPELVLVAGDVFHSVRPSNPAIVHAFQQMMRLRAALPDAAVVMVAGNHDTPRSTETGCILRLFRELGVEVVDSDPRRINFAERDLSILCIPDAPAARHLSLDPDPAARYNVLLLHGQIEGVLPPHAAPVDRTGIEITREELGASRWSYVALGHYHVYREIAPNAYYSGSLEYTSTNAWGELREERQTGLPGKGFIEHDLLTGLHRFHHIKPVRVPLDLAPLNGSGMTATDLDAAIQSSIESSSSPIDDQVVRLVVRDVPRHVARDLNHRALREYKRRALHFHLDTRRPEVTRLHGQGSPGRRPSLVETVAEKLRTRPLTAGIEREALVELGLHYLREAEISSHAAASADVAVAAETALD